jgi:hypothetical protein
VRITKSDAVFVVSVWMMFLRFGRLRVSKERNSLRSEHAGGGPQFIFFCSD